MRSSRCSRGSISSGRWGHGAPHADLLEDALARYARVAYSLEDFSSRDVTRARSMIRALVGGEIVLQPTTAGGLTAQLTGDYGGLIELVKEASPRTGRHKARMVAGARNRLYLLLFVAIGLPRIA